MSSQPLDVPGYLLAGSQIHLVPRGTTCVPRGRWVQMPGIRFPQMINSMAVVSAPAEIDVTTEQLRMVRRA